jgi:hypothetical protein
MTKPPTQSIEPTGGSRFCPSAIMSQWRLPPVAHARRSTIYENAKGIVLVR